jgi:hypothetical protein
MAVILYGKILVEHYPLFGQILIQEEAQHDTELWGEGRAIVQAVSLRLPTVAALFLARVRSCGITNKQTPWSESASDCRLSAKCLPTLLRIEGATWSA